MGQSKEQPKASSKEQATLDQHAAGGQASGPDAEALRAQAAAVARRSDGVFGLHVFPVGRPLHIVHGKVSGMGTSATAVGTAEVDRADAQSLVVTLHESLKKGFLPVPFTGDDTTSLTFTRSGNDEMIFTSLEQRHGKNLSSVLRLTASPTPNRITFSDEKTGKSGSIAWDEGKQQLTIQFSGDDNILVLSPNK